MRYTKSQVQAIGGKRYLQKRWRRILLSLGMCLAWIPLVDYMTTTIKWWVYIAPLALVGVNLLISYTQARNLLWSRYRQNPEILDKH